MLSRTADRVYWMARYMERTENTARLVRVHSELLLDLPEGTGIGWQQILSISGCDELYAQQQRPGDETDMLRFLLTDADHNPGCLLASLAQARENARTTREVMPSEAWRLINELYRFAQAKLPAAVMGRSRYAVLTDIIEPCQQFTGLLSGNMSHGVAYQFVRLGRNLERADMTTRVIDVAAAAMLAGGEEVEHYSRTLWYAVLRTLSAYQMYRQYVRRRVVGTDVIGFLLNDAEFPRSVSHCLGELDSALGRLPRNAEPAACVLALRERLGEFDAATLTVDALHVLMDRLQLELADVHASIVRTYVTPPHWEPAMSQSQSSATE